MAKKEQNTFMVIEDVQGEIFFAILNEDRKCIFFKSEYDSSKPNELVTDIRNFQQLQLKDFLALQDPYLVHPFCGADFSFDKYTALVSLFRRFPDKPVEDYYKSDNKKYSSFYSEWIGYGKSYIIADSNGFYFNKMRSTARKYFERVFVCPKCGQIDLVPDPVTDEDIQKEKTDGISFPAYCENCTKKLTQKESKGIADMPSFAEYRKKQYADSWVAATIKVVPVEVIKVAGQDAADDDDSGGSSKSSTSEKPVKKSPTVAKTDKEKPAKSGKALKSVKKTPGKPVKSVGKTRGKTDESVPEKKSPAKPAKPAKAEKPKPAAKPAPVKKRTPAKTK